MDSTAITEEQWRSAHHGNAIIDNEGEQWLVVYNAGKQEDGHYLELQNPSGEQNYYKMVITAEGRYIVDEDLAPVPVLDGSNVKFASAA